MRVILIVIGICLTSFSCKSKKESAEFFTRGNFHFKKKEYDRAEHFFSEAIRKDPGLADAYNNRGLIYLQRGEWEKAGQDFEEAVRRDKTFADARYNLAKFYTETGRADAGEPLFKDLQARMDTSSAFHNAYGQNFVMRNHYPEGEQHFNRALEIFPDNVEALTNLAYVKTTDHRYEEAEQLLEKALKLAPDFVFALNNRAVLYGLRRQWTNAIPLLKKAEQAEPNNRIVVNNLALFYLESGSLEEGREKVLRGEKLDENNEYTRRNRAVLLFKEGKATAALELLQKVEAEHPETDHIYYYLGQVCEASGKRVEACKYYETGRKLKDPWIEGECR